MKDESNASQADAPLEEPRDYDHVTRDEFTPMWEIAIFLGILLFVLAAIIAFD